MRSATGRPAHAVLRSLVAGASVARLHIAAIGAMGTLTFGWLLTGQRPWLLAAVSALDWFVVNLLNRAVDLTEDRANQIAGTELAALHRRALVVTGLAVLAGSLVGVHLCEPRVTPLRLGYHALGLAYNWPLLPARRRIKQLYFWKNTASAIGFVLTVLGYPLAASGWVALGAPGPSPPPGIGPASVLVGVAFFLPFEVSYEVIYDLRDAAGDRLAGLKTYPVVHGERTAVRIVDALLVLSVLPLGVGFALGLVPWRLTVMGAAPLLQLGAFHRALRTGIDARFCIGLTWLGVLLLVLYHGWILAELPGWGGVS